MTGPAQPRRRGSYGIDAPYWVAIFAVVIAANIVNAVISGGVWPFVPVVVLLACAGSCLYTTLRGKFVVWANLLDAYNHLGDSENVRVTKAKTQELLEQYVAGAAGDVVARSTLGTFYIDGGQRQKALAIAKSSIAAAPKECKAKKTRKAA